MIVGIPLLGYFQAEGGQGTGFLSSFLFYFSSYGWRIGLGGGVCCVCFCELCVEVPILAETEMKWKGKGRVERSRR